MKFVEKAQMYKWFWFAKEWLFKKSVPENNSSFKQEM